MTGADLFDAVKNVGRTFYMGAEEIRAGIKNAGRALAALALLAASFLVATLGLIAVGAAADQKWLISVAALLLGTELAILLLAGAPLARLIQLLARVGEGGPVSKPHEEAATGRRYIRGLTNIVVVQLFVCLILSVVPREIPLQVLPVILLATVLLLLTNASLFQRATVAAIGSLIFVALVASLFFPTTAEFLAQRLARADAATPVGKRVDIGLADIGSGEVSFFLADGSPNLWYHRTTDGGFEWYSEPGTHPIYGERLQPADKQTVRLFVADLEHRAAVDETRQAADEEARQRAGEEAARQALEDERAAAAQTRAARIRSYFNLAQAGSSAAVVVVDANGVISTVASQHIADTIGGTTGFFKEAFVSGGPFAQAFAGQSESLTALGVDRYPARLVLGRVTVKLGDSDLRDDMSKAEAVIDLRLYQTTSGFASRTANGRGVAARFSEQEARIDAVRLAADAALRRIP